MKIKLKPYLLNYMGLLLLIPQISLAKEYLDETMVVTANAGLSVDINKAAATMSVIDVQEQRKYQMAIDAGDLVADTPGADGSPHNFPSPALCVSL
ncbi:hypothetical protein [Vibrio splendidus]|uniref:hypothetical protein n=1 Tax=Vibrio splendidus TaxID=29497 RepID=UPI000C82EFB2|nr:hypothetical protein [Vibrio splendidus]PMG28246.1 hypothetical protein BCU95_24675 [Vibrio splendidus]